MKKRIISILLISAMVIALAAGCGTDTKTETDTNTETKTETEEEDTSTNDKKSLKIAYSIPEMFSTFWAACIKGFEEQCEEYGYEAITLDPNGDTELQMSQLVNQATTGADAIVISPIEKDTIGPTVDQITGQGIPVFCIDRKGSGDVTTMLTTDNYQAGVDMAKQMIEDYGESFNLLIVQGVLSDQPTIDRTAGVEDTIKDYPGIKLVGDPSAGEYSEEAAMSVVKNYLESNPDIDVIFLDTDALLKGAYAAITEAGHTGKVGEESHIGLYSVDGEGFVLDMIREGTCDGVYSQYPITLGADVVTKIKEYYEGGKLDSEYNYGGDVVTCENIESFGKDKLWGDLVR